MMKRIRIALALVIAAVLLSSLALISQAEPAAEREWQADLTQLMDPGDVPNTTEISYENTYAEGVEVSTHDVACELSVNGASYGCEFTFELTSDPVSDWSAVQSWLGDIVKAAARTDGSSSEALAKAVDVAIATARSEAKPDANGETPEWASENLKLKTIRVSTPFYPELSVGKNGDATERLQRRLIELGFLEGEADGYYGPQTEAAVKALEGYVRELEQDLIDERPTPTPEPEVTPEPTEHPVVMLPFKYTLSLRPRGARAQEAEDTAAPAAEATQEPVVYAPVTREDGVADGLLQAYIFSDAYRSARKDLSSGDSGDAVLRLQRRLTAEGCSTDAADGSYGSNTARAVRIFQRYNGLEQTGVADVETQSLLFSGDAKAPDNPMLASGASGANVERLQKRLYELGFSTTGADGEFGAGTKAGVEALQTYLRDREEAQLRAEEPGIAEDADLSDRLSTVVNGVADPILLDEFYSDEFPAVPEMLRDGSTGDDVERLQRRLYALDYFYDATDGAYGAQTAKAVADFQKRNKLAETGVANQTTMQLLFSGDARKALKPYEIRVSTEDQRVYAYAPDENEEYTRLVRTMKCSTGKNSTPTPKGTYKSTTGPGERWHYFKKFTCWAQYTYSIQGDILFHSVLYGSKGGAVTRSSVNNLGRKASHGCVRLSVEDAKWLFENCPKNTTVVVY